jgi:acetyl-CoA carboxylase beta subunit
LEKSISTTPPALIIIDNRTSCVGCPEGFQVSEFLRARGVYDRVISGNYSILLDAERFVILKRVSPATGGEGLSQVAFE